MNLLEILEHDKKEMMPESYKTKTTEEMEQRVIEIKEKFGDKLFIPGHHYQKNEVIQFSDVTGDSLQLAQVAAQNKKAEYIVFCGVHFMAETADMLTTDEQVVILPDMRAGCSMADMADIEQTERAWLKLQELFGETILPLTYVNSTAAIERRGGRRRGSTDVPYEVPSGSDRLEGMLVKGFPLTTSQAGIRVSECERIVRGWCVRRGRRVFLAALRTPKGLNLLMSGSTGANF